MITRRFDFDGGRDVTAIVPERADSVVFSADGASAPLYADALASAGRTTTAIVGVHALPDEELRLAEYSPVFDAARFAAHEAFFTETVRTWARDELGLAVPTARTAVFGASAGGELALALGLRHPDLYGAILAGSPGAGFRPGGTLRGPLPRTRLVAGTDEPFFLENATRWADALRDAGADVALAVRPGEHGTALWIAAFPDLVADAFSAAG